MRTLIDLDDAIVFAIPAAGGVREGVLVEGPQGWGEFSPPADSDDALAARWLTAAMEPGTVGWPDAVRGRVPVGSARRSLIEVADVDVAVAAITAQDAAAGGLEFVELVCRNLEDAAAVRRRVDVPIALDATVLTDAGQRIDAADVAVLRCGPLGGVRRALRRAEAIGLPCVVNLAGLTSIGVAGDIALAAVLPDLPFACGPGIGSLADGDVVAGPRSLVVPAEGYLPAAPMPAAPDPALVAKYAVTDPATVWHWRELLHRASAIL